MSSNLKQQQSYLLNLNKIFKKTVQLEVDASFQFCFRKETFSFHFIPFHFALFHYISYATLSHA